jgi:hypothetical protein
LDGIVLHNILNGEGKSHDWYAAGAYSGAGNRQVPVYSNVPKAARVVKDAANSTSARIGLLFGASQGQLNSFPPDNRPFGNDRLPRLISETFDTRLKLLPGLHKISGDVIISDRSDNNHFASSGTTIPADPYWDPGAPYIIHTILFEKYTLE